MRHLVFGLVMALLLSSFSSPGSSVVASPTPSVAFLTDTASNSVIDFNTAAAVVNMTIPVGSAPFGVTVLPDGSRVYVTNRGFSCRATAPNSTVSVINVADGSIKTTITVQKMPMGIAADPGGSRVYVANNCNHSLSVIETASDSVVRTISLNSFGSTSPRGVAVNPIAAMPYVYVTNRGSDDLAIVNTNDWSVVRIAGIGSDPYGVAVAKDGKTVYVALEGDGKLALVNAISLQVDGTIDVGPVGLNSGPTGVAVGRDGTVYVTNTASNSVWVVDPINRTSISVGVGVKPVGVSVSPNGKQVYVANSGGSLSAIDTASNGVTTTTLENTSPIAFGTFVLGPTAITVSIDIKPGSGQNTINLGSHGVFPVAILSTESFNAPVRVDPSSVTLAGAPVQKNGNGLPVIEERDVNGDGWVDLVVHIQTDMMVGLSRDSTTATLRGKTWAGEDIEGVDAVRVVPNR